MKSQRAWPVLLAAGIGVAILCGLGVWQVKRLAWKEALIAELNSRMSAEPIRFEDVASLDQEYTKVRVSGHFVGETPFRLIAAQDGNAGWRLVHPFVTDAGVAILVDRGILAEGKAAKVPTADVELLGIVRTHQNGRGIFDPDNDTAGNHWYWWDTWEMSNQFPAGVTVKSHAGSVLQLLPDTPGTENLYVAQPKAELRNNHLGYAITWFGLAAALIAVSGAFIWRQSKVTGVES